MNRTSNYRLRFLGVMYSSSLLEMLDSIVVVNLLKSRLVQIFDPFRHEVFVSLNSKSNIVHSQRALFLASNPSKESKSF